MQQDTCCYQLFTAKSGIIALATREALKFGWDSFILYIRNWRYPAADASITVSNPFPTILANKMIVTFPNIKTTAELI